MHRTHRGKLVATMFLTMTVFLPFLAFAGTGSKSPEPGASGQQPVSSGGYLQNTITNSVVGSFLSPARSFVGSFSGWVNTLDKAGINLGIIQTASNILTGMFNSIEKTATNIVNIPVSVVGHAISGLGGGSNTSGNSSGNTGSVSSENGSGNNATSDGSASSNSSSGNGSTASHAGVSGSSNATTGPAPSRYQQTGVGPLSGGESTGGRDPNDPIDTGGAGNPNNGAGENNAGNNTN